jgi:hypothetical protein
MRNLFTKKEWGWKISGLLLGLTFLITAAVVKPIGVSTQFVILDGIIWNSVSKNLVVKDEKAKKGFASTNAYLNKSGGKYAKSIAKPLNYSFIFVLAMVLGGFLANFTQSKSDITEEKSIPKVWKDNYGNTPYKRYVFAFVGGLLVLFGARLAGGCSSGHMMSGMMQTSISGYLFAIATFAAAIPVAKLLYRR